MKKQFLLTRMLLLCALIIGSVSSAWGEEVTLSLGGTVGTSGSISSKINWELAKGSGTNTPVSNGTGSAYHKIYAKNTITISSANSSITITKIVLTATANDYIKEWSASDKSSVSVSGMTATWSGSTTSVTLTNTANAQARIKTIKVTYSEVATPSISASDVNIAADILAGNISYSISNPDGSTMTAEKKSGDWLTVGAVDAVNGKVAFTATENTGEARNAVVTLNYSTASKDITITQAAAVAKHIVTIETPENGTLVIQRDGVNVASGSQIPEGTELTAVVTPNTGYKFRNWQAVDENTHTYTKTFTYTMSTSDVKFKANFDEIPQYTYEWNVNGSVVKSETLYEDADVLFPEASVPVGSDKVFYGWVTASSVNPDEEPSLVSTTSVTASANTTYYAVFATRIPGSLVEKIDNITRSKTGVDAGATGYSDWSGKTLTSSAVYAGNSAGGANATSHDAIQLRSKNNNSGVVSTTSGGFVKKVVVAWSAGSYTGTTIDIYGSNSAYSAASDLYDTSSGEHLGSIVKGTGTEITISGEYEYVGLRSNNNALCVDQISITWQTGTPDTYSEFTTTVPTTEDATISAAGWATYVPTHNVAFRSVTKAYIVELADNETALLTPVEDVPAGTPVLLEGASGTHTMDFLASSSTDVSDNCLKVSTGGSIDGVYVLADGKNGIGFYLWKGGVLNEGKVYLQIPTSSREFISLFDDTTTGITEMKDEKLNTKDVFNLNGMRVAQPQKGLYIVNGKKVVLK